MRKLEIFAGAFSAGIFLAQYLLPIHWLLPGAWIALAAALSGLLLPGLWRKRCVLIGVGLALALGYNWLYVRQVQRPMEDLAGQTGTVVMTVCAQPTATDYGAKVTVELEGLPGKAVYYGDPAVLTCCPGQKITDTVRLQSAARIRDDDITTFTSKGVFLLAYGQGTPQIETGSAGSLRWWPARLGSVMKERIARLYTGDTAGFVTAILTGDKSALSTQAAADLSEAGLYHVLAVSGMHCGYLLILIRLLVGRHRRRLVAACAVGVLILYALLTGGSPSVLRACVMLILLVAAPLFGRERDGPTSLAAALMLILLANPFAACSISLQLSFAAVAGILFLSPRLYRMLLGRRKRGKVFPFIAASFSATMGALVFTVPLSAFYFGTLVLISPVSNLVCLWAASVVFIGAMLSVLASIICWPLAAVLRWIPGLMAQYILTCAQVLAKVPGHAVYFANPYLPYWLVFAYLLFGLVWCLRQGRSRSYLLVGGLSVVSLTAAVFLGAARYSADVNAVVLNVGQGQSIALSWSGMYALVDCGSSNSWYAPGEAAAYQLRTMGCGKLDYLILTHFDEDHLSGVEALLARIPVEHLLVPASEAQQAVLDLARTYETAVQVVDVPVELSAETGTVTVYPPPEGETEDNERGLSVLASAGETDLLITGDMDAAAERKLLEQWDFSDVEVLVAGHHGSKYSTSTELLEALDPQTVCISVGDNSYGHPASETLGRLIRQGCTVYRTDLHGTVELYLNQGDQHGIREKSAPEE